MKTIRHLLVAISLFITGGIVLAHSGKPAKLIGKPKKARHHLASHIVAQQVFTVGKAATVHCPSPTTQYETVFEDDGQTGYFYAVDTKRPDDPICDAVHIYNVKNVTDRAKPSTVQIVWSGDGLKSALVINNYPHAVFDFADHRGYSRTNFPPPDPHWTKYGHEWHDSAIDLFN